MVEKKWLPTLPYLFLALSVIIFLATHSPNLEYDIDQSYILFGASRPPIYPLFIWIFHWTGELQFYFIMWLQGVFLFTALLFTRSWLIKNLQIAESLIFLICLFIIITIALHFQVWYIQSEGLAFPLFIFTFFLSIDCFQQFSLKKIASLALLVSILVLTRLQFYYFYALFILLCGYYAWQKIPARSLLLAILILALSICSTTLIDRSYHYFKHGFFSGSPYSGQMIMVQALYLAQNNAADFFSDQKEKNYVQKLIDVRNAKHLQIEDILINSYRPSQLAYAYQAYAKNYLAMQKIINDIFGTSVENMLGRTINLEIDALSKKIDKTLIAHNFKHNLIFFLWKFIECMGGVPLLLFNLFLLLPLPLIMIRNRSNKSIAPIFVSLISLLTFLNAGIIAICNPDVPVYFCYSQFMFYCLAAFLVSKANIFSSLL